MDRDAAPRASTQHTQHPGSGYRPSYASLQSHHYGHAASEWSADPYDRSREEPPDDRFSKKPRREDRFLHDQDHSHGRSSSHDHRVHSGPIPSLPHPQAPAPSTIRTRAPLPSGLPRFPDFILDTNPPESVTFKTSYNAAPDSTLAHRNAPQHLVHPPFQLPTPLVSPSVGDFFSRRKSDNFPTGTAACAASPSSSSSASTSRDRGLPGGPPSHCTSKIAQSSAGYAFSASALCYPRPALDGDATTGSKDSDLSRITSPPALPISRISQQPTALISTPTPAAQQLSEIHAVHHGPGQLPEAYHHPSHSNYPNSAVGQPPTQSRSTVDSAGSMGPKTGFQRSQSHHGRQASTNDRPVASHQLVLAPRDYETLVPAEGSWSRMFTDAATAGSLNEGHANCRCPVPASSATAEGPARFRKTTRSQRATKTRRAEKLSPYALRSIINPVDDAPYTGNQVPRSVIRVHELLDDEAPPRASNNQALLPIQPDRRMRSSFSCEKRAETSQTRAVGACLRCKSQRIRCVPSPNGSKDICITCEQVSRNSKKVLHNIHCVRWRLHEMHLFRHGGLELTKRWPNSVAVDLEDWAFPETHEIEVKIYYSSTMYGYDLCPEPVKLRVRRFTPQENDVLTRKWSKRRKDSDGVESIEQCSVQLPPYALVDLNETINTLDAYFSENALRALEHVADHSMRVIQSHMRAILQHYYSLADHDVEKVFLQYFFRLWFCIRFTTGSEYISGPDKLGCEPVDDPDYPLGDRISVPRMVTAQCDSLMVSRFLRKLSSDVLDEFEKFYRIGNPDHWFMLYGCTFMLLHEVSFSSEDRHRHAVDNWVPDLRYTVADFVKELQFSANIILCYWHYYRTMDPTDEGWDLFCQIIKPSPRPRQQIESAKGKGKKKVHITQDQRDLLVQHWGELLETGEKVRTPELHLKFEHPLYFVSQMYIKGWKVMATFGDVLAEEKPKKDS